MCIGYTIRTRILFFDKFYINFLMKRINEYKRLILQGLKENLCAVIVRNNISLKL